MAQTFAVISVHGPGWDKNRAMRAQDYWDEHATFIDGLFDSGFLRLGGPFPDDAASMIIVQAESADAVRRVLAGDPWGQHGILIPDTIRHWDILVDRDKG